MKYKVWWLKSFEVALQDEGSAIDGLSLHKPTGIHALCTKFRGETAHDREAQTRACRKANSIWLQMVGILLVDGKMHYETGSGEEQEKVRRQSTGSVDTMCTAAQRKERSSHSVKHT